MKTNVTFYNVETLLMTSRVVDGKVLLKSGDQEESPTQYKTEKELHKMLREVATLGEATYEGDRL